MTDTPQKKTLGLEYIRRRSREVRSQHQNVRSTKAFKKHLETGRSWDGFCCMLLLLLLEPHVLATMHGRNRLNSAWGLDTQDPRKACWWRPLCYIITWKKASEWHAEKASWTHPVRLGSTRITNPLLWLPTFYHDNRLTSIVTNPFWW